MLKSLRVFWNIIGYDKDTVEKMTEHLGNYYSEREIPKLDKNGKAKLNSDGSPAMRKINPSRGDLKKIQARIKRRLLDQIIFPACATGGVRGKSNVYNALKHLGKKNKFTTDLKTYFPSVSHKCVYHALVAAGFSCDVARWITKLTTFEGCLPQGTPTSTHLANLVFINADAQLLEFCKVNKITYTRYIDDLTFSSQGCFKKFVPKIIRIVQSTGFKINHKKTLYCPVQEITGILVKNNQLQVPKRIVEKANMYRCTPGSAKAYQSMVKYCLRIDPKMDFD